MHGSHSEESAWRGRDQPRMQVQVKSRASINQVRETVSTPKLTVAVTVLLLASTDMTSLTTRWFVLKEWVTELGATRTTDVT